MPILMFAHEFNPRPSKPSHAEFSSLCCIETSNTTYR